MSERLAASLADRYEIERRPDGSLTLLGEGGTATVYLAHDLRHDRPVALKVIHPELAASVGSERFLREIRFIARLSHPHILPLFDSGDADGMLYYVMPYVAGESLRQRLEHEGRLPLAAAVRIARHVGLALDYAHRNGLIHRDIKPENILLEDDQAVVADFGVATAMEVAGGDRLTRPGLAVGTPAYMSPEQAGGATKLDGRSDIYSLGCVLYEMLAGKPPFAGPTPQSVISQQLVAPLPAVRSLRPEIPQAIQQVLEKALAKEPVDRYATAAEFTSALESTGSAARPTERARRRQAAVLVGLGAAAATVVLLALGLKDRGERPAETATIAVLPFENLGPTEHGYFADGITEEITSRLAMLPRLGVISRTSADQYRESDKPLKRIGRELGVEYILEGSVRWQKSPGGSSRVRVTPQLIRVSDDRHLWAGQFDETLEDVFQLQSRIAEQVASALDLALQEPEHEALAAKPTDNLEAYDLYLRGNDYFGRTGPDGLRLAEEMYANATELDPTFALAFAKLARTQIWLFHFGERTAAKLAMARRSADSALRLQPELPEAHLALGLVHYWGDLDYQKALQEFRAAQARNPSNSDLAWARGLVERRLGKWDEARANLRRAVELDPRAGVKILDLFEFYLRQRDYAQAERYVNRAIELEPETPAHLYKAVLILTRDGDRGRALAAVQEGIRRAGVDDLAFWAPQSETTAGLWAALDSTARTAADRISFDRYGPDSGAYYLAKARLRRYRGDIPSSKVYFDSAATVMEGRTRARPDDPALHATLALSYAGLGRRGPAEQEGLRAVELRPLSKDTWYGVDMLRNLAVVYAMLGDADSAVKQLRILLSVPSGISVPLLRVDPTWDPVRRDPQFQALLK
jgi:eukaryotic-like serine/threonine-protein kinase